MVIKFRYRVVSYGIIARITSGSPPKLPVFNTTVLCVLIFYRFARRGQDEIFDMVKPEDPMYITFADLMRSGAGHTVVSMLVDVNGFWTYDNRESLK